MGTLTVKDTAHGGVPYDSLGSKLKLVAAEFVFSNSYATGGEACDLSGQLSTVLGVVATQVGGYTFEYDYTNKKLKAFRYDYAAGSPGAAIEVTAATNLSGIGTVRLLAWGYDSYKK